MHNGKPLAAGATLAVLVAVWAIAGATRAQAQPGPNCDAPPPNLHCVDVVVANGAIRNPPDVNVDGASHQIYWRLRTTGYTFPKPPARAITWKPAGPKNDNGKMPANEFPCNRVSDVLYHCTDANSTHGQQRKYEYAITVLDAAGKVIQGDPWIINQ